jgi:uncharacterized phage-associated protein
MVIEHMFNIGLTIYAVVLKYIQRLLGYYKVSNISFRFNSEKATEVILYLTSKLPIHNVYGICKMLYLADKASLGKYGRFLFGDSYVAMWEGGTPSNAYNLLKRLRENPTSDLKVEGNNVIALRPADLDYLSKSDIECLDQTIEKYGDPSSWNNRKKACHDDAWQKAWDKRGIHRSNAIPIESIAEMFEESDDLIDYLMNSG